MNTVQAHPLSATPAASTRAALDLRPADVHWTWSRFDALSLHDLYDALQLRCRVFILEQGPYLDADGLDQCSWHLLGRGPNGALMAYLRVVDPGQKYAEPSIGRVVTDAGVRGCGIGRALVAEGVARCAAAFAGQGIRISAQAHLNGFYASFGFVAQGDAYLEDGIPHLEMWRRPA